MSLIRWRNQGPSRRLGDDFDRMFQDFLSPWMMMREGEKTPLPAVNVHETDDALVVDAEIPGVTGDDLDISVHDGVLFIKGEKKQKRRDRKKAYRKRKKEHAGYALVSISTKVLFFRSLLLFSLGLAVGNIVATSRFFGRIWK